MQVERAINNVWAQETWAQMREQATAEGYLPLIVILGKSAPDAEVTLSLILSDVVEVEDAVDILSDALDEARRRLLAATVPVATEGA